MAAHEAGGGSEASVVASSSPNPSWWDHNMMIHALNPSAAASLSSVRWPPAPAPPLHHQRRHHQYNGAGASNNSSCDSGASMDSSVDLSAAAEPSTENHLWNQVLLSVNQHHSHHDDQEGEQQQHFLDVFSPNAFNYLKKMDGDGGVVGGATNWPECLHPAAASGGGIVEQANLSDLVSNWSIAPPDTTTTHLDTAPAMAPPPGSYLHYMHDIKEEEESSQLNHGGGGGGTGVLGYHNISLNSNPTTIGQLCNYGGGGSIDKLWEGVMDSSSSASPLWAATSSAMATDVISFKPVDLRALPLSTTKVASAPHEVKKQVAGRSEAPTSSSSSARGGGRSSGGAAEAAGSKKKRSTEEGNEAAKKNKNESSSSSSSSLLKLQVPKVKIGERITALQQIVSPFGKTDTASVLMEAINHIRFLQEQIQLLSDPYMKSNANKEDHRHHLMMNSATWGGGVMESCCTRRRNKGGGGGGGGGEKHQQDLKSRKLCLVPISCLPASYRDINNGGTTEYWTPTYRSPSSCLYR